MHTMRVLCPLFCPGLSGQVACNLIIIWDVLIND